MRCTIKRMWGRGGSSESTTDTTLPYSSDEISNRCNYILASAVATTKILRFKRALLRGGTSNTDLASRLVSRPNAQVVANAVEKIVAPALRFMGVDGRDWSTPSENDVAEPLRCHVWYI